MNEQAFFEKGIREQESETRKTKTKETENQKNKQTEFYFILFLFVCLFVSLFVFFFRNTCNRCRKPTNCVHRGVCLQEEGSLVQNVKGD
jgi:heme/copper-type cytochrome/quinol oxidase subunit 3